MYLNDPTLYGATLPYKDIPMQTPFTTPFMPWQQQRFVPQNFPQFPQFPHVPQFPQFQQNFPQAFPQVFPPFMGHTPHFFNYPQVQQPWMTNFNPFLQMQNQTLPYFNNLPLYNWQRPLPY